MSFPRYDIVGSFLRPAALKEAREKFARGEISQAELTAVEDQEIKNLVQKEVAAGLKVVSDGEFRRSYWHLDTFWGFGGVEHVRADHGYFFHDEIVADRYLSLRQADRWMRLWLQK